MALTARGGNDASVVELLDLAKRIAWIHHTAEGHPAPALADTCQCAFAHPRRSSTIAICIAGVSLGTTGVERDDARLGTGLLITSIHSLSVSVNAMICVGMVSGAMFGCVAGPSVM